MRNFKIWVANKRSKEYMDSIRSSLKPAERKAVLMKNTGRLQNMVVPATDSNDLQKWAKRQKLHIVKFTELV